MINITPEKLAEAMSKWILEADSDTLLRVFNENFDEVIYYDSDAGMFEIPYNEVERLGLESD
jgi:predicted Rdx family selenoprotein